MTKDEKEKLFKQHVPFIWSIVNKYKQYEDIDDLFQEGTMGFLSAIDSYNPDKGASFLTYAGICARGYILNFINKKTNRAVSVGDEGLLDSFNLRAECVERNVVNKIFKEETYQELLKTTDLVRDVDIVLSRYLSEDSCTLQDLGDKYGLSRQRIERIEKKVINKLKKKLKGK